MLVRAGSNAPGKTSKTIRAKGSKRPVTTYIRRRAQAIWPDGRATLATGTPVDAAKLNPERDAVVATTLLNAGKQPLAV
jgi:hypothetical protein